MENSKDPQQTPKEMLPLTPQRDSISDTEPKTLQIKNLAIQGIYGEDVGDPDPSFRRPLTEH